MSSSTSASDEKPDDGWGRWLAGYAATLIVSAIALYAFVIVADPFSTGRFTPLQGIDIAISARAYANAGRIRDPAFDSAIAGNSHAARLEPEKLDALTGRRFLQLSIPGLGPDDELQMMRAFVREHPKSARTLVFTIDKFWCETDDKRLVRYHNFPRWLYETGTAEYLQNILSLTAVQAAFHRAAIRLWRAPEAARRDGYNAREQRGIWTPQRVAGLASAPRPTAAPTPPAGFPPLDRLDAFLKSIGADIDVVLLLMPYHLSGLPVPGSAADAWLQACKTRIGAIGQSRPRTIVIDLMRDNAIARDANNFWDVSHVRDPVLRTIEQDIAAALKGR